MIKRVLTAIVLIPLVLWVIFWGPFWAFFAVSALFSLSALWEFSRILPAYRCDFYTINFLWVALLPWAWLELAQHRALLLLGIWISLAFWSLVRGGELQGRFSSVAANWTAILWIGVPFAVVAEYHSGGVEGEGAPYQLCFVLAAIWAVDSFAYFAGRAFGKHRITPRLSPNKTLEGFLAGLVGGVATALLFQQLYFPAWPLWFSLAAGITIAVAAIAGDLFESLLKRGAGIKDTSGLIPGHGGVLDRVDSLLFVVPAYHLLSLLLE